MTDTSYESSDLVIPKGLLSFRFKENGIEHSVSGSWMAFHIIAIEILIWSLSAFEALIENLEKL